LFFLYNCCRNYNDLRGQKPGEYELCAVYSKYVVGFSGAAFQRYSTRTQGEEAYQAFLNISHKRENMSLTSGVGKIG
jgi:hypothetical protein